MNARIILLVVLLSAGCGDSSPPSTLTLTGATVIDVRDGSRTPDAVVIIEAGRISAIGSARDIRIPSGARVVDVRGKYMIPGLWDVHTHIQNQQELDIFFPLLIAHGVVGIRDAGGLLPREFRDMGQQQQYAPHVIASGAAVDGPAPAGGGDMAAVVDERADSGADYIKVWSMLPRERFLAIMTRARQRGLHVAGHAPVAVGVAEASDLGLATMEHLDEFLVSISSRETELRAARLTAIAREPTRLVVTLAFPPIEPLLSSWSDDKASALFKKLVTNRTWQTPTLELYRVWGVAVAEDSSFWNDRRLGFIPKDWQDSWRPDRHKFLTGVPRSVLQVLTPRITAWYRAQMDLVRRMHAAGVGFLAGTDASQWNFMVPGLSLHDELARFVEAGFSPLEALQTATINPAEYLGITDSSGTLGVGKRADILVLDADPTGSIANTQRISAVVLGGRFLDRAELDRILAGARQRATAPPRP